MKNQQVQLTAFASFAAAAPLAELPAGDAPEYNLQFMPPGAQDIVCWVNGKPRRLNFTVTARHAELFNGQLQKMIARAQAGEGDKPLTDYNHEDGAASSRPYKIEWGGDDQKNGGIRLIGKWTSKARAAIRDEEFDKFSPKWDFDNQTGEPLEILTNLGGLVNQAAFKKIAAVQASDASGAVTATDEEDEECKKLSAAAHKASSKAYLAKPEDAVNAHTDAHKAHLAAATAMKAAGNQDEADIHKDLAAHHKTKVMEIAKTNLAAASAVASSATKPSEQAEPRPGTDTTKENKMTETEIATAVAKGVEAANKPLVEKINGLETKITGFEKNQATAQAKTAVQKHVQRGAIAPQDADGIAFWETAYAASAENAEKQMAKLPVVARGRVIPGTTSTATAGAADPAGNIVAQAQEIRKKNTAFASDAAAMEVYLRTPQGIADYESFRKTVAVKN